MKKFSFSGHETFSCKIYWLKKGYDFILSGKKFTDEDAVVELGVGKNMVTSIRFWLKAFGIVDDNDETTQLADFLFGNQGCDPYLEDPLSLWLLHYQLMKSERASIYPLIFNDFRRERNEFTKDRLFSFLNRKIEDRKVNFSDKTLESDVKVFFGNYTKLGSKDIEEAYSTILQELALINHHHRVSKNDVPVDIYSFNISKKNLAIEALIFVVLDNDTYGTTVSINHLANDYNSVGNVFLLTEGSIIEVLRTISSEYGIYSETAGNPVLQLNPGLDKFTLLKKYYKLTYASV